MLDAAILSTLTVEQIASIRAALEGELACREGSGILLGYGSVDVCDPPPGGAILYDRPAIGGDSSTDTWYPTIEAAEAALCRLAGRNPLRRSGDRLEVDLTVDGCAPSRAWVAPNPRQASAPDVGLMPQRFQLLEAR